MTHQTIEILFITLGILMLILIYKFILRRLSKGRVVHDDFCTLYSLEKNPASGIVEFYFTTPVTQQIEFCIWNQEEECTVLKKEEVKKGGQIVRFDTRDLKNGIYTFGIITNVQKTIKKFRIEN